jgi:hypothetical protein
MMRPDGHIHFVPTFFRFVESDPSGQVDDISLCRLQPFLATNNSRYAIGLADGDGTGRDLDYALSIRLGSEEKAHTYAMRCYHSSSGVGASDQRPRARISRTGST